MFAAQEPGAVATSVALMVNIQPKSHSPINMAEF